MSDIYDPDNICDRLCVAIGYGDGPIGLVNPDGPRAAGEIQRLRAEIERLRLTDEERAALHWFAHYGLPEHRAATLRGLLDRIGHQ